jgi:putative sigma-54 modulation protein
VQLAITCRHGSITQDVHEYISTKSEKLLTYFDRVTAITVTVDFENDHAKVEILVDAEHKHNFVAQEVGDAVPAAFDIALHKMEQQIRRYKEKLQDHRRTPPINEVAHPDPSSE